MKMNVPSYVSGEVFSKAYRILRINVGSCLEQYHLTPSLWIMLGVVARSHRGARPQEVAKVLGVKAPLITSSVDSLIARNLVKRVTDPADSRARLLLITPEGRKLIQKAERDMNRVLDDLLAGISQAELMVYKRVLDTIIANGSSPTGIAKSTKKTRVL